MGLFVALARQMMAKIKSEAGRIVIMSLAEKRERDRELAGLIS